MNEDQRLEQAVIEAAEECVALLTQRYGKPNEHTRSLFEAVRRLQAARRSLPTEPGWWWGSEGGREPEPMIVKDFSGALRTRHPSRGWIPVDTEHVTWMTGPNPRKAQRALPWTRS